MKEKFYVCLSHDVDRVSKSFQFITHFFQKVFKKDLKSAIYQIQSVLLSSHYWCFDRIMEIERKLGLRSTFFFLNESYPVHPFRPSSWKLGLGYYDIFASRVQKVIREMDNHGWEIGLHGSYLSFKDTRLLRREKHDLESILGHSVLGVRQHYLNLDQHTWQRQAEEGFLYDASFGFAKDIGFRENRYTPFNPMACRRFYVVPLALMDSCVMAKEHPLQEALKVVNLAVERRACLVLNWHQRMFNDKEFPGYVDMYIHLIDECRKRKAHFSTIAEYIIELDNDGKRG